MSNVIRSFRGGGELSVNVDELWFPVDYSCLSSPKGYL